MISLPDGLLEYTHYSLHLIKDLPIGGCIDLNHGAHEPPWTVGLS